MTGSRPKERRSPEEKRGLLYLDVAAELRSRITNGRYKPNSKLPTVSDLVDEFGVSAISVRRALRELSYEGLIVGEQGRGTFVKPKGVIHRVFGVGSMRSIGDSIRDAGFLPRIQELKPDRVKTDVDLGRRLQIATGIWVNRHRKLVFADDVPVSLHFLYFTEDIAPRLRQEIGKNVTFDTIRRSGFSWRQAHCEFGSVGLPGEYAPLFLEAPGFPMGVIHFTPVFKEGKPPFTGMTICRSDRFVFEVDISVGSDL